MTVSYEDLLAVESRHAFDRLRARLIELARLSDETSRVRDRTIYEAYLRGMPVGDIRRMTCLGADEFQTLIESHRQNVDLIEYDWNRTWIEIQRD